MTGAAGADLWTGLQARLGPLPVEVGAASVCTQVTPPAAIRVHVGDNIEDRFL